MMDRSDGQDDAVRAFLARWQGHLRRVYEVATGVTALLGRATAGDDETWVEELRGYQAALAGVAAAFAGEDVPPGAGALQEATVRSVTEFGDALGALAGAADAGDAAGMNAAVTAAGRATERLGRLAQLANEIETRL